MRSKSPALPLVLLAASLATPATAQEVPTDVERLTTHLGFREADVPRLFRGEVIELEETLAEGSDKEMAVGVAILLPTTVERAVEIMRLGLAYSVDGSVIDYRRLPRGEPSLADFEELGYAADELEEVKEMLKVKAGSRFNFSEPEVERFQRLAKELKGRNYKKDPSVREAVNAELRGVLLERYRAYRAQGVQAIEPYTRGRKQSSPAEELTLAIQEDALQDERLASVIRDLQQAWYEYPEVVVEGVENDFFWTKTEVQGRPCFVLTHLMSYHDDEGALFAERQFYVGHNYNSLTIIMGAVPVEDGLVMFYRNRTFTDQVAGFGGGMKKGIGRGQMKNTVIKLFKEARRQLERGEIE